MLSTLSRRSRGTFLWILPWILLVGTACVDEPLPEKESEIVFGWISPGVEDHSTVTGATLASRDLAAQGGILLGDRRIAVRLEVAESVNSPEIAAARAFEMINRKGAVAILGLASTATALPVARIAETHQVPMVSILSSHPDTTTERDFAFRLTLTDRTQGQVLAQAAVDHLGARRAGMLIDVSNPHCVSIGGAFQEAFEALGGEIGVRVDYTEDQPDLDATFEPFFDDRVDFLFLPNVSPRNAPALTRARQRGLGLPVLGGDSWSAMTVDERAMTTDLFYLDLWAPELEPAARRFADEVSERHGLRANASMVLGYDAVSLVAEAIRLTGRTDPESIRDSLATIEDYRGLAGPYRFRGTDGTPHRQVYLRHLVAGEESLLATLATEGSGPPRPVEARAP